jgi:YggT family protein
MLVLDILRYSVFAIAVVSAGVAVGSWALRTRRLNPFGRTGQLVRRVSDPLLDPVETWLLRRGGNPQHAGWWLLGMTVGGGLLVIVAADWLASMLFVTGRAAAAGPRGIIRLVIYYGGQFLLLALIVRVIGSWFGVGRFNRWMRPAYVLTDWIVEPLRRVMPRVGMFDVSPIVAWVIILLLRGFLLGLV